MFGDAQHTYLVVTIVGSLLAIVGTFMGWTGRAWRWAVARLRPKAQGVIDVPKKTLILFPVTRADALRWDMGTKAGQPEMHVECRLNVTNISQYVVRIRGAKLRKPPTFGHASVRQQSGDMFGDFPLPQGHSSELIVSFGIAPPRLRTGRDDSCGHRHP